jgi:hypothetical protein
LGPLAKSTHEGRFLETDVHGEGLPDTDLGPDPPGERLELLLSVGNKEPPYIIQAWSSIHCDLPQQLSLA